MGRWIRTARQSLTAELRVALKLLARTRASTQRSLQQLLPWRQHRLTLVILLDLSKNINVEYAGPDLRVLVIFQKKKKNRHPIGEMAMALVSQHFTELLSL